MAANKIAFLLLIFIAPLTLKAQKKSNQEQLKSLIQNSFDDIFSEQKKEKVTQYYTDDFLLLEAGVVWNMDSVYSYIERANARKIKPERINTFDFLEIKVKGKTAWVAYQNYADIRIDGKSVVKLHWLESGSAIKTKEGWKLELLHSTVVPR
ncbi:nuclear transport factor 2 family protein [Arcticibacterium luteifluviistationis]|uniref:DUF4440 domain-containing protein n=1 Tax=Arcticibacterium luteifluviistationis TaxID=1784714 RepID=A0A2Z4G9T1_9BACT|nr:nuclear transport factor 2 family protein [Arcticibacterium luteifluviistationis]AWV97992.1 DUF4440 domain-containing protein [Arcticibacterium luteifluviistationis]